MIHNHEVESSSLSLATFAEDPSDESFQNVFSGCSSARLEYTSGGRVVAGSNPVIPTNFFEQTAGDVPAVFLCLVVCGVCSARSVVSPAVCFIMWRSEK